MDETLLVPPSSPSPSVPTLPSSPVPPIVIYEPCDNCDQPTVCNPDGSFFDAPPERVQNFWGLMALIAFLVLGLTSLNFVRRRWYEVFYYSHIICMLVAIYCLYSHHFTGNLDVVAPYALLILLDYSLRCLRLSLRACGLGAGNATIRSATTVGAGQDGGGGAVVLDLLMPCRVPIEAGQYFFLCIPSVSCCQWHPFSVVGSRPCEEDTDDGSVGTLVEIAIKGLGSWSNKLVAASEEQLLTGKRVLMDGPYGELAVRPERYSHCAVFVAGVGCTPFLGLLEELQEAQMKGEARTTDLRFVWSLREVELYTHYLPLLERAAERGASIDVYLTRTEETELEHLDKSAHVKVHLGRPDIGELLQSIAKHYRVARGTDTGGIAQGHNGCALLSCGPTSFVQTVIAHSATAGKPVSDASSSDFSLDADVSVNFDVHTEVFEF